MSSDHQPLPVAGYKPQSSEDIALANEGKMIEEFYLRWLEKLSKVKKKAEFGPLDVPAHDPRMISLAKTKMQEANMWAVRSIFQPTRIKLPGDPE